MISLEFPHACRVSRLMPRGALAADESYSPVLVVGGVAAGSGAGAAVAAGRRTRGRGLGAGAAVGAGGAGVGAAARPPLSRSADSKLTFVTVVAGGPTGGATALPTLMRK